MQIEFGAPDPRVRSFVMPSRIVWSTAVGVEHAERLLQEDDTVCSLRPSASGECPAVLLDFGRELHGGVRLDVPATSTGRAARIRVRFGESVTEAMASPSQDHAIHDHATLAPWFGHTEIGNTGFRFVRIDLTDPETAIDLRQVRAVFLRRPDPWLGSFECSDERLNAIWRTGAYTVHLCMQDHVWDGIKRDRLVWVGDLHPEAMVIATVFGANPIVPASLDYVRDRTPLPGWMNGISSYSLWWILLHRDWYQYTGDLDYLRAQRDYLLGLLRLVEERVGDDGLERLDGMRFLEWPTSDDPTAIDAGLQALVALALQAGVWLCNAVGEPRAAARAFAAHTRAVGRVRAPSLSKQANALAVLAGLLMPEETNERLFAVNPDRGISTFYGYYVLQARALAGDWGGCLDLIRSYWGAMLDRGATTFWEGFELDWLPNAGRIDEMTPAGMRDLHADFGGWCYKGLRHSLCHGWAAGPTAWLTEHVLGLTPASPGFERLRVDPHLAGLEWARGALPTPRGLVRVEHRRRADGSVDAHIEAPAGVEVERAVS
ncbi:MAG TPA: alpha-L-rhamnosidase C-terminal domain-containing protein [Chthonomonadales bacterium]|nr:alpha-L-rhamnosidase C-terminal domain-containing protein [Chthonomonadales bacterium]